jgi:hypothetical protein
MQVGDYIIQERYKHDSRFIYIFKLLQIQVDGYLRVELQAGYDAVLNKYHAGPAPIKHITRARIKLYHPTLEELFIFKSFKEQS